MSGSPVVHEAGRRYAAWKSSGLTWFEGLFVPWGLPKKWRNRYIGAVDGSTDWANNLYKKHVANHPAIQPTQWGLGKTSDALGWADTYLGPTLRQQPGAAMAAGHAIPMVKGEVDDWNHILHDPKEWWDQASGIDQAGVSVSAIPGAGLVGKGTTKTTKELFDLLGNLGKHGDDDKKAPDTPPKSSGPNDSAPSSGRSRSDGGGASKGDGPDGPNATRGEGSAAGKGGDSDNSRQGTTSDGPDPKRDGTSPEPRRTVSQKEAPEPWTSKDVEAARERAGGVDHRTQEPLRPDGPNGERRWHMKWDPDSREWVAENPGKGHTEPSAPSGAKKGPSQIGSFTVPEDAVRVKSGSKGGWEHSLYSPEPNKTYLVDDKFAYVTDERGRVKEAHGVLEDAPRDAAGHRQTKAGGVDRLPGDEGGHIFGKSLGGPGEDINLLAMSRDANRSQYAKLENEWRSLLKGDRPPKIEATVRPVYEGTSTRPTSMLIEWTKDGKPQEQLFIDNEM